MRTFLFLVLFCFPAYAQAPDRRICDCEGDCANITASGELEVSSTNDNTAVQDCDSTQKDFRISDNEGHVANVTSTGELETA